MDLPKQGEPLSVILKLVGESCNIDCGYCYEKRRTYLGSRLLQPETVRTFCQQIGVHPLSIELHGGEPLLTPKPILKEILDVLRKHPYPVSLRMQTNALLLTSDWLDFFAEEWPSIQLGVSLDGDLSANNWRRDMSGEPTHAVVSNALQLIDKRHLQIGIISVVTRSSLGRAQTILQHLATYDCVRIIKFVPCFDINVNQGEGPKRSASTLALMEKSIDNCMPWAIMPDEYANFLIDAWQVWYSEDLYHKFIIEPLSSIIRVLNQNLVTDCHFSSRKCAHVITLYPDGRIGTCDEIDHSSAIYGTIDSKTVEPETLWRSSCLSVDTVELMKICNSCSHKLTCGGGCVATRLRLEQQGLGIAYCNHRKKIIDYVANELSI